jgi:hypothetical protein
MCVSYFQEAGCVAQTAGHQLATAAVEVAQTICSSVVGIQIKVIWMPILNAKTK